MVPGISDICRISQLDDLILENGRVFFISNCSNQSTDINFTCNSDLETLLFISESENCKNSFNIFEENGTMLKLKILCSNCVNTGFDINVSLDSKMSESHVGTFFYGEGSDSQTVRTSHIHNASETVSMVISKSVLDDSANFNFEGDITIKPDAILSDASQKNNNFLLSDFAHATSKPNLNILNNDVLSSHGATVGSFNNEEKFYMASRGICEKTDPSFIFWLFKEYMSFSSFAPFSFPFGSAPIFLLLGSFLSSFLSFPLFFSL